MVKIMCGFLTWYERKKALPDTLAESAEKLTHRGPDEQGKWEHSRLNLAFHHRRLSIIDIECGQQPLVRAGNVVVLNGEIYNYRQLREQLKGEGYEFRTDSDTEVFLQGYRCWRTDFFERIRGMFAAVVWDEKEQQLVAVRDNVGQKPLFYYNSGGTFAAASEIQALLGQKEINRKINYDGLADYFRLGYYRAPETGFERINKLKPGHYLKVDRGEIVEQTRYWNPASSVQNRPTVENPKKHVRDTVTEAIKSRLVSDVPVGAFLSGGIDSSIIVGVMQKILDEPVKTVSVGFSEDRYDERDFARQVAEFNGTDHHEYSVDIELPALLPRLVKHVGEPYADSSLVPTFYVSSQTSKVVKVALSGDGGDEVFGGYRRYRAMKFLNWWNRFVPDFIRSGIQKIFGKLGAPADRRSFAGEILRLLQMLGEEEIEQYLQMVGPGGHHFYRQVLNKDLADRASGTASRLITGLKTSIDSAEEPFRRMMLIDIFTYLPGDLLIKTDIASMMNSLECRCPFLDKDVVKLGLQLPEKLLVRDGKQKHILRQAFADILPEEVYNRGKQGFGVPLATWFRKGEKAQ
ncbi:MAG: asparagine synthase (glutamine-hydrolyzing), partial [bacterium]